MGEVSTCAPPPGAAAGAAPSSAAGAGEAAAGAEAGAGGAAAAGAAGPASRSRSWPSILSRKPERSISRPCSRWLETSSISSLICSKFNKRSLPRASPARLLQVLLEQQSGPPQLEPRPSVDAALAEDQHQVVTLGHRADHEGEAIGGDRELLYLAHLELAVVVGDAAQLGDQLRSQQIQVEVRAGADRFDRDAVLVH